MFQRDYLLKLIEEAAFVLSRLVGMRQQSKLEEAQAYLDQIYDAYFPFSHGSILGLEAEDLIRTLQESEDLESDHLSILADLLREEAEMNFAQGKWDAGKQCLRQASAILHHLNADNPAFYSLDRMNKLAGIQKRLDEHSDN
jgi:hypothetical protein